MPRLTLQNFWILILIPFIWPWHTGAQIRDPDLAYRTLRTEHFAIHYHEPLGHLARRYASIAEEIYPLVSENFGYRSDGFVHVLLTDEQEDANGSATPLPYNTIRLYAAPPDDMSPLSLTDEWPRMLLMHEFTHIVNTDQATGLAAVINTLFGKSYLPNQYLPTFLLEGTAVWQETNGTAGGRLRSPLFRMMLNADALHQNREGSPRFLSVEQITHQPDRWPHGNIAYVYGSYFVQYFVDTYGKEALKNMYLDLGDALVPYGINRSMLRVTGKSLEQLYDDFRAHTLTQLQAEQTALEAYGIREGRMLTHHGEQTGSPVMLQNGHIIYVRADGRSRRHIVEIDAEGHHVRNLVRVSGDGEPSLGANDTVMVYSHTDNHRDIYFRSDIYAYNLQTQHVERLTQGWRAKDPSLSPDGKAVVFVIQESGSSQLMIAERADVMNTARPLLSSLTQEQAYAPSFSPDGRFVVASVWKRNGFRDLVTIELSTGKVKQLTHDRAIDSGPVYSKDGTQLFFWSDRSGIANIYCINLETEHLYQVTHSRLGAFFPAVSEDGHTLTYLTYSSFGYDIATMPMDRSQFKEPVPLYDVYQDAQPLPEHNDRIVMLSEDYQPLETLLPRSYSLSYFNDGFGGGLGLGIAGKDIAELHQYNAKLNYGIESQRFGTTVSYTNAQTPLRIHARFLYNIQPARGLFSGNRSRIWAQENIAGDFSMGYRFPSAFHSHQLNAGWSISNTAAFEPLVFPVDPNTLTPRIPDRGLSSFLRFQYAYSDVERYRYDISNSNGRTLQLNLNAGNPAWGNRTSSISPTWSVSQYIPLWDQHVLAMRYGGGLIIAGAELASEFSLGGFPSFAVEDLANLTPISGVQLRGYPVGSVRGSQFHLMQLEYRFPLWRISQGVLTHPLYFNRTYLTVFCDVGGADDPFTFSSLRTGVGAELFLDMTVSFFIPITLRVGYAHGFSMGGTDQFYVNFGNPY